MTAPASLKKLQELSNSVIAELHNMSIDELCNARVNCFGERALLICSGKGDAADLLRPLSEAITAELQARGKEVKQ